MPYAPPSRCPIPGCRKLTTTKGRCDDHQPKPWRTPSANTRQLTRKERQVFHDMTLTGSPTCACTGWCGTHTGQCKQHATEADHIIPIGMGGARLAAENAQPLCSACHSEKTKSDNKAIRQARSK